MYMSMEDNALTDCVQRSLLEGSAGVVVDSLHEQAGGFKPNEPQKIEP
jgi:hypothetical protein